MVCRPGVHTVAIRLRNLQARPDKGAGCHICPFRAHKAAEGRDLLQPAEQELDLHVQQEHRNNDRDRLFRARHDKGDLRGRRVVHIDDFVLEDRSQRTELHTRPDRIRPHGGRKHIVYHRRYHFDGNKDRFKNRNKQHRSNEADAQHQYILRLEYTPNVI